MKPAHAICALAAVIALPSCEPLNARNPFNNLFNGEPLISNNVWNTTDPIQYQTADANESTYLPPKCGEDLLPASKTSIDLNKCVEAMRTLIDSRYQAWVQNLTGSLALGNSLIDTSVLGLSAAGGLIGGVTSQIMNVVSGALTGTKNTFNTDVFLKSSVQTIVLQMNKDRACWNSVIQARLNNNSYQSREEAFNDLYAYSVAGSFSHAVNEIQVSTGAQANANQTAVQTQKTAPAGTSDASTTTSKTTTQDSGGSSTTTTTTTPSTGAANSQGTQVSTCGANPAAPTTPTSANESWTVQFAKEGQTTLDAAAISLIQQAAADIVKTATTTVSIVGHADTTGAAAPNQAVATARANAVKAQLLSDKVPASQISSAKGDPAAAPQTRIAVIQENQPAPPPPAPPPAH